MDDQNLLSRAQLAATVATKAAAMRKAVYEESLRYEGAVGAIKQAMDETDAELQDNQRAFRDQDISQEDAERARNALVGVHRRLGILLEQAKSGLMGQRGKLMQADDTLNMMKALFDADLREKVEPEPTSAPSRPGKHPGPSLAQKRRLEAVQPSKTM